MQVDVDNIISCIWNVNAVVFTWSGNMDECTLQTLYNRISTIYPLLLALSITCSLPFQKQLCMYSICGCICVCPHLRIRSTKFTDCWKRSVKELTIQTDIRQWMYFSLIKLFFSNWLNLSWSTWPQVIIHFSCLIQTSWNPLRHLSFSFRTGSLNKRNTLL